MTITGLGESQCKQNQDPLDLHSWPSYVLPPPTNLISNQNIVGPMYSSDLSTDSGPLQQYIEPLLKKYNVDLAMWGHMHCYERTYPGR